MKICYKSYTFLNSEYFLFKFLLKQVFDLNIVILNESSYTKKNCWTTKKKNIWLFFLSSMPFKSFLCWVYLLVKVCFEKTTPKHLKLFKIKLKKSLKLVKSFFY